MNKKKIIRRIEDVIGVISVLAVIALLGSFIAMIEEWQIITGSVVAIIICLAWFGIVTAYYHMINTLFNK